MDMKLYIGPAFRRGGFPQSELLRIFSYEIKRQTCPYTDNSLHVFESTKFEVEKKCELGKITDLLPLIELYFLPFPS